MNNTKYILLPLGLWWTMGTAFSQPENDLAAQLLKEDSSQVEALVLYPEDVRESIFEAAMYPAVLVKMADMQQKTSEHMAGIVSALPREEQEEIWNMVRYPGLVDKLGEGRPKSEKEIEALLQAYPADIHDEALKHGRKNHELLKEISNLQAISATTFEAIIKEYPASAQNAFRKLLELPEVLDILTENLRLTVLVGEHYRTDPERLRQTVDSLHLVIARQRAGELEAWKNQLADDPEALRELQQSSEEFANYTGNEDAYTQEVEQVVITQYVAYPYPYWLGYPWWYSYPRWYPYPWWYDCGFYYSGGAIVVFDLPSSHFFFWYFHHPWHHYYYPHFSNSCVTHYYHHPRSRSPLTVHVRNWTHENSDIITPQWLENDGQRVERFREYGRLEKDLREYNTRQPGQTMSRERYLSEHKDEYPTIVRTAARERQPAGEPVNPLYQPRPVQQQRAVDRTRQEAPAKVDRSPDFHKAQWQPQGRPDRATPQTARPQQVKPPARQPATGVRDQRPQTRQPDRAPVQREVTPAREPSRVPAPRTKSR